MGVSICLESKLELIYDKAAAIENLRMVIAFTLSNDHVQCANFQPSHVCKLSASSPQATVSPTSEAIVPYDVVKHLPAFALCLPSPTTFGLLRKAPPDGSMVMCEVIPKTPLSLPS